MRNTFIVIASLLLSCSGEKRDITAIETEFIEKARHFHELYVTAGDCAERNAMVDKDIIFLENGQPFTYADILEYCSYIKPKNAFDVYVKQYLIQPTVGFDYVEQYYLSSAQDTLRETTSRIWELKSGTWVVTHMQVSRHPR